MEDKGWWKGELDGKVGVFPDNFVKLLPQEPEEVGGYLILGGFVVWKFSIFFFFFFKLEPLFDHWVWAYEKNLLMSEH